MSNPNQNSDSAQLLEEARKAVAALPEIERGIIGGLVGELGLGADHPDYAAFMTDMATEPNATGVERFLRAYEQQIVLGGTEYAIGVPRQTVVPDTDRTDAYPGQFAERQSPTGLAHDYYSFERWLFRPHTPDIRGPERLIEFVRVRHNTASSLSTAVFGRLVLADQPAESQLPPFKRMGAFRHDASLLDQVEHRFARAFGPEDDLALYFTQA